MRKKEDWLYAIQNGRGKEIAREFFLTFFTQREITKKLYPTAYKNNKKDFVMPIINHYFQKWNKLNFFDRSRPIQTKHKPKDFTIPILNLKPLFKFCKEKKKIEFTEEEKEILTNLLLNFYIRKQILKEYPRENIINAVLKFYVKHYVIPYGYILRFKRDFPEKFKKYEEKAERVNKDKNRWDLKPTKEMMKMSKDFYTKEGFTKEQIKKMVRMHKEIINKVNKEGKTEKYDFLDILSYEPEFMWDGFRDYISKVKKDREIIYSIDEKFMRALGIFLE